MLKRAVLASRCPSWGQPPSGGCVLKPCLVWFGYYYVGQPPSGGCVLKPESYAHQYFENGPAAFRRLCVETPKTAIG